MFIKSNIKYIEKTAFDRSTKFFLLMFSIKCVTFFQLILLSGVYNRKINVISFYFVIFLSNSCKIKH